MGETPSQPSPADWGRGQEGLRAGSPIKATVARRQYAWGKPHPSLPQQTGEGVRRASGQALPSKGPLHIYLCVEGNPIPAFPSRLGKGPGGTRDGVSHQRDLCKTPLRVGETPSQPSPADWGRGRRDSGRGLPSKGLLQDVSTRGGNPIPAFPSRLGKGSEGLRAGQARPSKGPLQDASTRGRNPIPTFPSRLGKGSGGRRGRLSARGRRLRDASARGRNPIPTFPSRLGKGPGGTEDGVGASHQRDFCKTSVRVGETPSQPSPADWRRGRRTLSKGPHDGCAKVSIEGEEVSLGA